MTSTTAQLQEMGEETEFACETLSDYRDLIMGLTDNKVDIMGSDGEYKSTYQMLKEISEVWEEMNSMEQSSLMKSLFGTRQANIGASILENFDIAESALATSKGSAGSAEKEQAAYAEGIQYSLDVFKAQFQELANTAITSDFFKGLVDSGTAFLELLTQLIDKVGILTPLLAGIGVSSFVKNFG